MGMCSSKLASCFQWISSKLEPYEDLPILERITTSSTSLPSSSSSSRLDPYEDLPIQERITTASTSLPSSSSSASTPKLKWTYDVFLSFRGGDVRNNFVDHLYKDLKQKGINTFRDDEKLERGKEISGDLLKAIEESRFAIIIFSENYASSSWCLDELVKIIDCMEETGQIVYPVFYNMDPSNVRNQKESFAKAFDEHEKKNLALGKMEKWKEALSHAGSIAGWDTRDRPEADIIQKIVEKILYMLSRALLHVDDNLVGMEIHMKEINTLLDTRSKDVKFVGIHGLGGIGKTTIAKVIYNQIYNQFEGCSYLANVRERCEMERNLVSLQKQLLYEILKVDLQIFNDDSGSSVIQHRLNNQKVLVILDDVDHINQLEKLAGNGKWFGPGSRIIITTRDQHLLNTYEGVQRYKVKECDRDTSLEIFSWKAFEPNYPREDYMELSNEVVHYTKGLPLALTVLGSHLRGRRKDEWKDALDQLKIIPNEDVTKILKISYKGLNSIQKDVFLDIACFFNGKDKDEVMQKLDSFGFFPRINIQVLIDKSLITVSAINKLMMHDLVRDMGRHIGKRSRLWKRDDISEVLSNNAGTEDIQGIQLTTPATWEFSTWEFNSSLNAEVFTKMKNLRFLSISYSPHFFMTKTHILSMEFRESNLKFPEGISHFPDKLKIIEWERYPIKHSPLNLVLLQHLKSIDLSYSENLREFPDVTGLPNLERLSLRECEELVEIHPSVWLHKGLKLLDLNRCISLGSFPNKIEMESLETLDLGHCYKMKEFPEVHGNMKRLSKLVLSHTEIKELPPSSIENFTALKILDLWGCVKMEEFPEVHENMKSLSELVLPGTAIKELPSSIENFSALKILNLNWCKNLVCLPSSICKLKYLEELHLIGCSDLDKLPENIGDLESLVNLDAYKTAIKEVPASIQFLVKLRRLSFDDCRGLKLPSLYGLPSSLTTLNLSGCDLTDETFPSNIECLSSLVTLVLSGNNFVSLPTNITQLSLLNHLLLGGCWNLEKLPENLGKLESLVQLDASKTAIKEVPASIQFLDKLSYLSFAKCSGLKLPSFYGLSSLKSLDLTSCDLTDETFPNNIECLSSLEALYLSENNFVSLPVNISQLSLLMKLDLSNCKRIESIPELPSSIIIDTVGCTSLTSVSTPTISKSGTLL